ncbi:MAG: sugar phosphate isomerase/epimerase family protein [Candidatus Latescibacterota bacterium]
MFKAAIFTDEVSQDFQTAVDVALEYGLDGLEIRSVWGTPPQGLEAYIPSMKKILAGTGLAVCSIASPFLKCDIDSQEEYQEHLGILERCIALAQAFDCALIRGFTFWRKGKLEDQWRKILRKFEEPVRMLEDAGMILAIENEASTCIGTGGVLRKFLDDLDAPHVKSMWDAANVHFDDVFFEVPYPNGYEAVKQDMVHMHLKDARRLPEPECVPIGEGDIDYRGQFAALATDGYEGYVSLETHWRPVQLTVEAMDRPGGNAFSASGEYASRICLANWMQMLKDMGLSRPCGIAV